MFSPKCARGVTRHAPIFAPMLDDILLREAWRLAVVNEASDLSFYSYWTPALDESPDDSFPACIWGPVNSATSFPALAQVRDSYTCRLYFYKRMGSNRPRDERDEVVSEMRLTARAVLLRFRQLYVRSNGTVRGATLDLSFDGDATIEPVYDEGQHGYTGVNMTVRVIDNISSPC